MDLNYCHVLTYPPQFVPVSLELLHGLFDTAQLGQEVVEGLVRGGKDGEGAVGGQPLVQASLGEESSHDVQIVLEEGAREEAKFPWVVVNLVDSGGRGGDGRDVVTHRVLVVL